MSGQSTAWTGWGTDASGDEFHVTSDRLGQQHVANRWFPKVRSWLALGAPLELLSPLSIARIVGLVAVATWLVSVATGALSFGAGATLTVVSIACVILMMRLRVLSPRHCVMVTLFASASMIASLTASVGEARVVVIAGLFASLSVFNGLFLAPRWMLTSQLVTAGAILLVVAGTSGGEGLQWGATVCLVSVLLALMTRVTARTSRLAGSLDPDTGLPNARGLADVVRRRDPERSMIIATAHLRGVAQVRDALGHQAGSELVRRAVEDLGQVLPASAQVGRDSHDDVVILLAYDPTEAADADEAIERVVDQVERAIGSGRYLVGEIEVALNVHVGIVVAPIGSTGSDADELLRRSSLAARAARDAGRTVSTWDGESTTLTAEDLSILADLRTAAERDELWVAYQPQVRSPDGRIVAVEALLRWNSERHGQMPPGRFIPLAERTGLVDRLTEWVLAEALNAQVRWRNAGFDITVSVNVSPLSLHAIDFADRVLHELEVRELPCDVLMLEVTESVAFDVPEAVERLAPLRARGVKVSIDDFGTGYTSLAILPRLPLDELKVDQQFVRDAVSSPASEAIVRAVCDLGHRLGLSVVAEGVEDARLAGLMAAFGFDLLQGYHFARPQSEADLLVLLTAQDDFTQVDTDIERGSIQTGVAIELAP